MIPDSAIHLCRAMLSSCPKNLRPCDLLTQVVGCRQVPGVYWGQQRGCPTSQWVLWPFGVWLQDLQLDMCPRVSPPQNFYCLLTLSA